MRVQICVEIVKTNRLEYLSYNLSLELYHLEISSQTDIK